MSATPSASDSCAEAAIQVQTLIDLTDALSGVFKEENAALEAQRPNDAAPLQAEKARLAAAYAQSIRTISTNRAGIGLVDGALLARLRSATVAFEARAARQRLLLDEGDETAVDLAAAIV